MRPWVLDLFCCAGGAARGYQQAGFAVLGVDRVPRPNYAGDMFLQADALLVLGWLLAGLAQGIGARVWTLPWPVLVHASPPCQEANPLTRGTNASRGWGGQHDQLVPETRRLLDLTGLPYVIEQPAGSKMIRRDLMLCMDMFPIDPPRVWRHRDFELSGLTVPQPVHTKHEGRVRGWRHGVNYDGDYVAAYGSGGGKASVPEMQHALGIDWTDVREELTEAIPPAYTQHIGWHARGLGPKTFEGRRALEKRDLRDFPGTHLPPVATGEHSRCPACGRWGCGGHE